MVFPDPIFLQSSLLVTSKSNWLALDTLKLLINSKHLLNGFTPEEKDLLLKFDLFGLLNIDFKEVTFENLQALLVNKYNDFKTFVALLEEIQKYYKINSFDNFDIFIFNARIYRFFAQGNLSEFQGKEFNFKNLLDKYLSKVQFPSNFPSIFYNLYTTSIVYKDFFKLVEDLKKVAELYSQIINNNAVMNCLFELTLFYRAYVKLPREVLSYVDPIGLAGFLFNPNQAEILVKEDTVNNQIIDLKYVNEQLNFFNQIGITDAEIRYFLKQLTEIYPNVVEAIYNFNQLIKGSEPNFTDRIELIINGSIVEISSNLLNKSKAFPLVVDEVINLIEEDGSLEVQDLFGFLIDFIDELNYEYFEDIDSDNLMIITESIFKGLFNCYQNNGVNLLKKYKDYNLLEFIDIFSESFPLLYKVYSGNLSSIGVKNGLSISSIIQDTNNYLNLQLHYLNELKNEEFKNKALTKRVEFLKSIENKELKPNNEYKDHAGYIKDISILCDEHKILDKNFNLNIEKINLNQLKEDLDSIVNIAFNKFNELMALDPNDQLLEIFQELISILNKLGLSIDISVDGRQISIAINESQLRDYLIGYNNTEVIDSQYSIENLTAFSIYSY